MRVVVDYLQTNPTSGVLSYRRKFPKELVRFIPSRSPTGKGRVELKVSLRGRDLNAPGVLDRYRAAEQAFDEIVASGEQKRAAFAKRASGAFDELDGPTIAALAARYHAQELADDEARRLSPEAKADAREATKIMRGVGFEFPRVPEAAEWTLSIREANETIREAARSMRAIGIEGVKPNHAWRHLFTNLAVRHGLELSVAKAITGHATSDVQEKVYLGDLKDAVDVLARELEKMPRFLDVETPHRPSLSTGPS